MRRDDWLESLWMGPTVYSQLSEAASAGEGRETCGVLLGHRVVDAGVRRGLVIGCAELFNAAKDPIHNYAFDAGQQSRVWDQVRAMRLEMLGIWHSHPTGPAHPSQTDVEYMQPWLAYAILSPRGARWALACYRVIAEKNRAGYAAIPHEVKLLGVGGPTGPGRRPA